jgi:hypothetical protein
LDKVLKLPITSHGTTWKLIPTATPHFGGIWEAGVKSMKTHLEEFSTVLIRIEACLNSRPITPISSNPTDLESLTPGHFLIGRPLFHQNHQHSTKIRTKYGD